MSDDYKEKYEALQQKVLEDALRHFDERIKKLEQQQVKLETLRNKAIGFCIAASFTGASIIEIVQKVFLK